MKSKTSFFNWGISKNLLRRCWPLWTAYLLLLLLVVPLPLLGQLHDVGSYQDGRPTLNASLANFGEPMLFVSLVVGVLAAMCMFSYLYSSRGCGMMNSLPVTRTTMFFTAYLTGLVPLLAADLLTAALTALICLSGYLRFSIVLCWLGVSVFSNILCYGFACFCAMLTGNLIVLPLVYLVLNFTAYIVELVVTDLLQRVVFGMTGGIWRLTWLSPVAYLWSRYRVVYIQWPHELTITGMGAMAVYALVGLGFTLLAWRLYLKRQMETATDTVAIPVLKPVFKYCMCFGAALVFADLFISVFPMGAKGGKVTLLLLALLLIGAFLGYYIAEMLIQKTVRVFRGGWKGFLVSACILALLLGAWEFDLFGYERRVPDASDVEWVGVNGCELREEENIERALALHRSIISNKAWHEQTAYVGGAFWGSDENWGAVQNLSLDYRLKNGKTISRRYTVYADQDSVLDPDSDLMRMQELINTQEALACRAELKYEMAPKNVVYAQLAVTEYYPYRDHYDSHSIPLSGEELVSLWNEGILPDLAEGKIGRLSLWPDSGDWKETNVSIDFELADRDEIHNGGGDMAASQWFSFVVCADDSHCLDWIEAHTGERPTVFDQGENVAFEVFFVGLKTLRRGEIRAAALNLASTNIQKILRLCS